MTFDVIPNQNVPNQRPLRSSHKKSIAVSVDLISNGSPYILIKWCISSGLGFSSRQTAIGEVASRNTLIYIFELGNK